MRPNFGQACLLRPSDAVLGDTADPEWPIVVRSSSTLHDSGLRRKLL
jgi:hypothetical protein